MILREEMRYIIISDKLLFMKLSEYQFGKGYLYGFKVYLSGPSEDAVLPVSVTKKS